MENFIGNYWELRLAEMKEQLKKNNFDAVVVRSPEEAGRYVLEQILPEIKTAFKG